MRKLILISLCLLNSFALHNVTYGQEKETTKIRMFTSFGDIDLILYNKTPQHRDNFIKLVNEGFYDSLLFHRVIEKFMIQGGDPESRNAKPGTALGNGGPGYTIPAEFDTNYFHKRGALAAARESDDVNPEKASSGSQFYIVQGKVFSESVLKMMEQRINQQRFNEAFNQVLQQPEHEEERKKLLQCQQEKDQACSQEVIKSLEPEAKKFMTPFEFTKKQMESYTTIGGAPQLDGGYTVFGEVTAGMEVVDQIASVTTDQAARPVNDVVIFSIEIIE